jgi:antagonist of KipI
LGSRSTHLVSRMGGFNGRALAAGDRVPLGLSGIRLQPDLTRDVRLKPDAADVRTTDARTAGIARVRVIPDRQLDRFEDDAIEVLQSAPYWVGHMSDRMGFRLEGPMLLQSRGADIMSDVTPLGTLQVPASGQPILLMADRPTTGGYTRIATVISADIAVVAQLGPGDAIAFERCTLGEAIAARVASERAIMALEHVARA